MGILGLLKDFDGFSLIIVRDNRVTGVSQAFTDMTEYSADDFIDKDIKEAFNILKVGPDLGITCRDKEKGLFIFTKSLEVRFVNMEVINTTNEEIYVFKEISNSRFEEKYNFLYQTCNENIYGVAVFSVPDFTLLKANQMYLDFLDPPCNKHANSLGKRIDEIITWWKGSSAEVILNNVAAKGKPEYIKEHKLNNFLRGITYWDMTLFPLLDNGSTKYLVVNFQEVTERVLYRKQLEEKNEIIEKQKKELDTVLDNMIEAFSIVDRDGNYVKINKAFGKQLQDAKIDNVEDSLNKIKFLDMQGVELPREQLPFFRVARGESLVLYTIMINVNGVERYVSINGTPIFDENGNFSVGVFSIRDITSRRQQSRIIREQNERLKAIIDNVSDAVFVVEKSGAPISYNSKAKELTSVLYNGETKLEERYKKSAPCDFEGNRIPIEKIPTSRILKGERFSKMHVRFDLPDRSIYMEASGTPIYDEKGDFIMGVLCLHDITELINNEKQMRIKKEMNEAILDNMQEFLFVFDGAGKCLVANKMAREGFFTEFNIIGDISKNIKFYDSDGCEIDLENTPAFRVKRGEIFKGMIMNFELRGRRFHVLVSGAPVFDENGEYKYGIISCRNITDFIESQQALEEVQNQLLELEREKNETLKKAIEMKDEFLSLVSHEFRTPLNVINTAVQAVNLIYWNELPDKVKEYINIMRMNIFRQLRLVNNLLDITRANAGRIKICKKNIDIVFLTRAITESIYHYASHKGVYVTFVSSFKEKIVGIDEEKYERILLNLLSNAIKFTPVGKSITISLRSKKGQICLEVKDTGIGIPRDKIDVIFERFGQVDSSLSRQAEGTGIGLSLVKKLVEASGGSISVKSREGKGSTFTILLPADKVPEEGTQTLKSDLMNNHLIESINVEFSDIYL